MMIWLRHSRDQTRERHQANQPAIDAQEERQLSNRTASTEISALIDRSIAIWNETDPAARRTLIEATWAEDATYTDPALNGAGRDGIDAMTAGF